MLLKHKYPNILSSFFITAFFAFPYFSQALCVEDPDDPFSLCTVQEFKQSSYNVNRAKIEQLQEIAAATGQSKKQVKYSGTIANSSCQSGKYNSISKAAEALGKNQGSISCHTIASPTKIKRKTSPSGGEYITQMNSQWFINCHVSCQNIALGPDVREKKPDHCDFPPDINGNRFCSFAEFPNENCSVPCTPIKWSASDFYSSEKIMTTHRRPLIECSSYSDEYKYRKCRYLSNRENEKCTILCQPKNTGHHIVPKPAPVLGEEIYVPATKPNNDPATTSRSYPAKQLPPASQGLK